MKMNINFKNLSLSKRITTYILLITLLISAVTTVFVVRYSSQTMIEEAESSLQKQVVMIGNMFDFYHRNVMQNVNQLGELFFNYYAGDFKLDPYATVQVGSYDSPILYFNDEVVNLDFSRVDEFNRTTGGSATVFVRYQDDFLRVATSLKNQAGERAIGTLLGKEHPGYQKLINNEIYNGHATLFGKEIMARYIPVTNASGEVIAVLYIGFDFSEGFAALKETVARMDIGHGGYAFLMDNGNKHQGELLMHPEHQGKHISDILPEGNKAYIEQILSSHTGLFHYVDLSGNKTLVVHSPSPLWGWTIASVVDVNELTRTVQLLKNVLIGLNLAGALMLAFMIYRILGRQLRPLKQFMEQLCQIGHGDLTQRLKVNNRVAGNDETESADEITALASNVNVMTEGFTRLVSNVLGNSGQVAAAAEELSKITEQTSSGVLRQQGEIEQIATAMNEMSATVTEVAKNAANAATAAQDADEQAKQGGEIVNHTVETINTLASEVQRTSEVIENLKGDSINIGTVLDVIRDIAEQTNLLALNAAIEAARAGEQGRGFAVVADEVRTLASRTQQSTQEINDMIERLQSGANQAVHVMEQGRAKAEESVEQAAKAGVALDAITRVVDNIKSMNIQIASAAEQQSDTAEEINRNIVNISNVAQETASGSQQTATASDELARLAINLQEQVGEFKL